MEQRENDMLLLSHDKSIKGNYFAPSIAQGAVVTTGATQVLYQAAGAASGLVVTMDVYMADKTRDETQSGIAIEIGTTGRYYLMFNADGPGWFVLIHDNAGGSAVKQF